MQHGRVAVLAQPEQSQRTEYFPILPSSRSDLLYDLTLSIPLIIKACMHEHLLCTGSLYYYKPSNHAKHGRICPPDTERKFESLNLFSE